MKIVNCVKCGAKVDLLDFEHILNPWCWKCKEKEHESEYLASLHYDTLYPRIFREGDTFTWEFLSKDTRRQMYIRGGFPSYESARFDMQAVETRYEQPWEIVHGTLTRRYLP